MTEFPLDKFLELHDQLEEEHPKSINEARRLAKETVDPKSASVGKIWRILWDKPLFANVRVKTAERWVNSIEAEMEESWQIWGEDPDVFKICQVNKGRRRDCFNVQGEAALSFESHYTIPRHRLYAIQGAAEALRSRTGHGQPPFADLRGRPLSEVVPKLCDEFKWGWGEITVLHALTDMGLAVKPDLHLTNTMRHFGLNPRDPLEINAHVGDLLCALRRSGRANIPKKIRYVDKVLMEISRQGIIDASRDRMLQDILEVKRRLDRLEDRLGFSGKAAG